MRDPTTPVLPRLTERLRIRALRGDDLENLWQIYNDPLVARFIGVHTRDEVSAELSLQIAHQARRVLEKAGLTHTGEREAYGEQLLLYEVSRSSAEAAGEVI
jgi:RimJ/RimL family protein N-acetyltransferase